MDIERDREFILFNKRHIEKQKKIIEEEAKDGEAMIKRNEARILKCYYEMNLKKLMKERGYTKRQVLSIREVV